MGATNKRIEDLNLAKFFKLKTNFYPKEVRYILLRNCNYNCFHCHSERVKEKNDEIPFDVLKKEITTNLDYLDIVHLTGGEPLIYSKFDELINFLNKKGVKIHLTTNGYLLDKKIKSIKKIDEIHVSIPSLNSKNYEKITGINGLGKVLSNIHQTGLHIEINFLPIKSFNNIQEIPEYIKLCKTHDLKAINVLHMEGNPNEVVDYDLIKKYLKNKFKLAKEETILRHNHPADAFNIDGIKVNLCEISMYSKEICANCPYLDNCNEGLYHPRAFYLNKKINYQVCTKIPCFNNFKKLYKQYVGTPTYKRRH